MHVILILLFGVSFLHPTKAPHKMCITVDDIPCVTYGVNDFSLKKEITTKLIATFDQYKIPAIGYVVERQLYTHNVLDSSTLSLLEYWLDAGYDLGNHTFSHYDYNKVSDSIYFHDILDGEKITRKLCADRHRSLRFFRHPYLHVGATKAKRDSLFLFLSRNGYTEAPVTVDNADYMFAKAYHLAWVRKDSVRMKSIGQQYISYMDKKIQYFEGKSDELFHRNITQTLLIHGSLLNADYLDELAAMYTARGYTFVSQAEALKDKAYTTSQYYTSNGISWIFRWAFDEGRSTEFSSDDTIGVPVNILEWAKN